ncbi:MAG: winged helix-turn-helix domain-containing protein [Anaerolineaceae bacterium]|nr:winged helix-turn-helix domain-containing protein [Formivibrio sp.]MDR3576427.1 winged helix-turn-helix domain-containing protein [Anaerolineaceae bacterium]
MQRDRNLAGATHPRADQGEGFGRYRIFPELRLLLRYEKKIEIGARAFDILWMLLEAKGNPVSKDDLIEKVWAGAIVEENNHALMPRAGQQSLQTITTGPRSVTKAKPPTIFAEPSLLFS